MAENGNDSKVENNEPDIVDALQYSIAFGFIDMFIEFRIMESSPIIVYMYFTFRAL